MTDNYQNVVNTQLELRELRVALQRSHERLQCVSDVVRDIASLLDLDQILDLVATRARDLIGAEKMIVPIVDHASQTYCYRAATGKDADLIKDQIFPINLGMCGWVLTHQQPVFFGAGSVMLMGKNISWKQGMESALLVPLMSRGKIVGGLSGLGKQGGASFSADDQALLELFAAHISIAIENAMIFQQLKAQKSQLQSILDNAPSVIYIKDKAGKYLLINRRYEDLFGVTNEFILGKTDYDIFPKDIADAVYKNDQGVLQSGKALDIEEQAPQADGDHTYISVKFPLYDASKAIYAMCGISTDITDYRKAEDALRRAQKMDAIGQLTGGIAHDFNNQLGIVIGYLDMLGAAVGKQPGVENMLTIATRATMRCTDLTRQLLAFSRKQSSERENLDLNSCLAETREIFARSLTSSIQIEYQLAENIDPVYCNKGECQDAMLNMVINARDAMPTGGKLCITTQNVGLDVMLSKNMQNVVAGSYVKLTVADTGSGMSKAVLDRIYEPFFTTKPVGKGTGLGMAMVYGFVKRCQGQINIYSEPGKGTNINIYLPAANTRPETEPTKEKRPEQSNRDSGNETILLVDDDADLLELTQQFLQEHGYKVWSASGAEVALSLLEQHADIRLLLSDVIMPDVNGFQLADQVLQRRPDMRVLLVSGFAGDQVFDKQHYQRYAEKLLNKPYRKDELVARVRQILN